MKKYLTIAMLMASSSAYALDQTEQGYIVVALNTVSVSTLCGYNVVSGSISKFGEQVGVDDKIGNAAFEAIKVIMKQPYDSAILIPEVTRFVNNTLNEMVQVTSDKAKYCRVFVPILLEKGTIEKK